MCMPGNTVIVGITPQQCPQEKVYRLVPPLRKRIVKGSVYMFPPSDTSIARSKVTIHTTIIVLIGYKLCFRMNYIHPAIEIGY